MSHLSIAENKSHSVFNFENMRPLEVIKEEMEFARSKPVQILFVPDKNRKIFFKFTHQYGFRKGTLIVPNYDTENAVVSFITADEETKTYTISSAVEHDKINEKNKYHVSCTSKLELELFDIIGIRSKTTINAEGHLFKTPDGRLGVWCDLSSYIKW